MTTQAKKEMKQIPRFSSLEEMAEFWDTHDSSEYEHEFEPVEFEIAKPLRSIWMLSIRLDKETFDALREIAKPKGLGASTLARMWILEELERVRKSEGEAR
ncbi:MAG: CopG family antitoxin [Thermomicrobiales bacterium]